jgi:hypothetical protein
VAASMAAASMAAANMAAASTVAASTAAASMAARRRAASQVTLSRDRHRAVICRPDAVRDPDLISVWLSPRGDSTVFSSLVVARPTLFSSELLAAC